MALLVIFILLHGNQVMPGIQTMGRDSPVWAKAIGGLYALANISVVLTQFALCFRATRFFHSGAYPRRSRRYVDFSGAKIATMFAVTFGGQIAFLLVYRRYG